MGWPLQEVLGVPWCMVTCEKGVLGMAGGTVGGQVTVTGGEAVRERCILVVGERGVGARCIGCIGGGAGVAVVGVSSVLGCPRDISRVALLAVPAVTF